MSRSTERAAPRFDPVDAPREAPAHHLRAGAFAFPEPKQKVTGMQEARRELERRIKNLKQSIESDEAAKAASQNEIDGLDDRIKADRRLADQFQKVVDSLPAP